jgi:hypothetical protein
MSGMSSPGYTGWTSSPYNPYTYDARWGAVMPSASTSKAPRRRLKAGAGPSADRHSFPRLRRVATEGSRDQRP